MEKYSSHNIMTMHKIIQRLEASGVETTTDHHQKYMWNCYPDSHSTIITPVNTLDVALDVVHNPVTGQVFEASFHDEWAKEYIRWIHPQYIRAYYSECFERQVEPNRADHDLGIDFEDTDNIDDIWVAFEAAFQDAGSATSVRYQNIDQDTAEGSETELITLDLSRDELATLALAAHHKDMKINDFINEAVWENLKEMEREGLIDSFSDGDTTEKGAV